MKTKKRGARAGAKRSAKQPTSKAGRAAGQPLIGFPLLAQVWPGEGGRFAGLIISENGQPNYAIAVADPKHWPKGQYGPRGRVSGAESEYDGLANTKAMAAAESEVARQALAVTIEGHNDFYIASRFEERLVHLNRAAPGHTGWAWSSTQTRVFDDFAWAQDFDDGAQGYYHKGDEFPVVLVRRVPIR